jgi:hypothetical protein
MALATSDDVVAALGRSLTSAESTSVANLLDRASDRVFGYLGSWPDPVPGPVARVVAEMVAAVFDKPTVTTADYDATGYSTSREYAQVTVGVESATSSGPWLTKSQKLVLDLFRPGVRSVGMVGEGGQ